MRKLFRFVPLALILCLMLLSYLTGFYRALDFGTIRYHYLELIEYVNNNPILTPFMFIGSCAIATTLTLPGRFLLGLLGGLLFPQPWCSLYLLVGMGIGATAIFVAIKIATKEKKYRWFYRVENIFNEDQACYLLFFSLIPFSSFWLTSFLSALFNVRLRTYIWTMLIGAIPRALILTFAGKGFNTIFESTDTFSIQSIFNAEMQLFFLCLATFALLPIVIKKCQNNEEEKDV